MIAFVVAFLAGQALSAWIGPGAWAAVAALAGLGVGAAARGVRAAFVRTLAACVLGAWLAGWAATPPGSGCVLPAPDDSWKRWLVGEVVDGPWWREDGFAVAVRASIAHGEEREPICGLVRLSFVGEGQPLLPGERFRAHAHLRRPRDFANPGAPDQSGSLARRRVWTIGYTLVPTVARLDGRPDFLAQWREAIARRFEARLPESEAALLRALVLGDPSRISEPLRDAMVASGLAHLLAVSGLHVGAVWGIVFFAVRRMLGWSEWLLLRANVGAISALAALVPATLYGMLAGGRSPTGRAVLMIACLAIAGALGRELKPRRALALAALGLALASPGAPLEVSFQLSFMAVLGLVLALERAREGVSRLHLALVVPAVAFLATAPITALHFNRLSPAGLITNPLLVPLCGVPATLAGLLGASLIPVSEEAADVVLRASEVPLAGLRLAALGAGGIPGASVRVPTPTLLEIGLLYATLLLPWLPGSCRARIAAGLALVALLDAGFWIHDRYLHRDLRVRFLDVGQGDAAVVELPGGGVVVVDGGGFARSRFDVGERVVARYLLTRRILRIDVMVVTHGDWDHQGGLRSLAREFRPRELWRSADPAEAARVRQIERRVRRAGGRVRVLSAGQTRRIDGVAFETLNPPANGDPGSANDASLVLRLSIGEHSILLSGDVEASAESRLRRLPGARRVTVLKVPHHGSRTSSTPGLLATAEPQIAIVSVGSGNRYGLPDPTVLARYRAHAIPLLRTDRDGSVEVKSDGKRLQVRPFADRSPAFCGALGLLC